MNKKLLIVGFAAVFGTAINSGAQTKVIEYSGVYKSDGVVYALPKTEIKIAVTVEKTMKFPGPFYMYAERFLAEGDFIKTESVEWSLSGVAVEGNPVADEMRRFQVMPDKKGKSDRLNMSDDGVILSVGDCSVFDDEGIRSVVSDIVYEDTPKFRTDLLGEEVLMATSIPKMAEMTAKQIYRIREGRTALIACELENMPDGEAVGTLLERLDFEERELVALFIGKIEKSQETVVYAVTPRSDLGNLVVARLSTTEGLLDADNVIGSPIYLNVKGEYVSEPVDEKKGKMSEGFAYVVPGKAEVKVINNGKTVAENILVMPQFGYVARLSGSFTDRHDVCVRYSHKSGRIVSVR